MLRASLAVVIVVGILTIPHSTSEEGQAILSVDSVLAETSVSLHAPLHAMTFLSNAASNRTTEPLNFQIDAEAISLKTEHHTGAVVTPATIFYAPDRDETLRPNNGPDAATQRDWIDATLAGIERRDGFQIFLISSKESILDADASCQDATIPAIDFIEAKSYTGDTDAQMAFNTTSTFLSRSCGPQGDIRIKGSFMLSFWEADFLLKDREGNQTVVETGNAATIGSQNALTGSQRMPAYYSGSGRQAFLHVQNGELHMSFTPQVSLYLLPGTELRSDGVATLQNPRGVITTPDGNKAINAPSLALEPAGATMILSRQERAESIDLELSGMVFTPIAGQTNGFIATPDQNTRQWIGPLPEYAALGAAITFVSWSFLTPLAVGAYSVRDGQTPRGRGIRGTWAAGMAMRATKALRRGQYRRAATWSGIAARIDPYPRYQFMLAAAFTGLRQFNRALKHHEVVEKESTDPIERARNACEAAKTHCALRDETHALQWLVRAHRHDCDVLRSAIQHPEFQRLQKNPWFIRLLSTTNAPDQPRQKQRLLT